MGDTASMTHRAQRSYSHGWEGKADQLFALRLHQVKCLALLDYHLNEPLSKRVVHYYAFPLGCVV